MTNGTHDGHEIDPGSTPTSWARFFAIGCFTFVGLTSLAGVSDGFATFYTPLAFLLAASRVVVISLGAMALYWYAMAWLRNDPTFHTASV